jgi:hypothetical protein
VDAYPPFAKRLIMTPKYKAKELVDKFTVVGLQQRNEGIQCALIAVDEIFQFMKMDDDYTETASNANSIWVNYFNEVKKEIELL